jgi:hypothetical protein
MNYQEKFEITPNNASYFSKQFDILITGWRDEEDSRHIHMKKSLPDFKGIIFSFDTCENADKFNYKIESFDGKILEQLEDKSLIPDLEKLLREKKISGSNLCIDITTLKQGILFLLVKLLVTRIKPARFLAAYTEPTEYKKREIYALGETEEYDLYDKIIGSQNPVPGFTKPQSARDIMLVAPIGFDCQRLQTIYENIKPKKIIPVVGFPSFVPGWDLTAIKMNFMVLKGADCYDELKTCEAASPFEMYSLLETEFHRHNRDFDVYVSPLGTRPHCLGAALFVAKNSSAYLIYDFPVEKKYRSESVLKADIYNLSKYIG